MRSVKENVRTCFQDGDRVRFAGPTELNCSQAVLKMSLAKNKYTKHQ